MPWFETVLAFCYDKWCILLKQGSLDSQVVSWNKTSPGVRILTQKVNGSHTNPGFRSDMAAVHTTFSESCRSKLFIRASTCLNGKPVAYTILNNLHV